MSPGTTLADEDLLIAVANTAHDVRDELADPAGVRAWWAALGQPVPATTPADPGGAMTSSDPGSGTTSADLGAVEVLRTLRAVIRGLALRNNGIDTGVDVAALEGVVLRPDLSGVPGLRAETSGDLARDVGAATVTALLRASARPSWPRLKACRGEDCRWVFLDGSRNSSRRWCDMAACGNRAKSASFRDRRRGADPR